MTAKRVYLRHPRGADESDFLAAVARSESIQRPWNEPPADTEAFREWLGRCESEAFEGRLAALRETDELVGVFNLSQVFRGNFQSAYLGYYVFAPHQGRGLMSEGLELMLAESFGELQLHRVEANIQPGNARSIALAERVGFLREGFSPRYLRLGGEWRDHVRYALTAEDWASGRLSDG